MPEKIPATIRQRAVRIKLFLCDVGGGLTAGRRTVTALDLGWQRG